MKDTILSLESMIAPQLHDPFVTKLITLISGYRVSPTKRAEKAVKKELEKMVENRFGIPVVVKPGGFAALSVAALGDYRNVTPMIANQSVPIVKRLKRYYEKLKESEIVIDLKHAKVIKMPDIKSILYIDYSMMSDESIPEEEVAAIILHEIGHLFTFLEMFGRTVSTNTSLLEAFILAASGNDGLAIEKLKIITKTPKDADKTTVIVNTIKTITEAIEELENKVNQLGDFDKYHTDEEVMADSFVVKFGLGLQTAKAVKRLLTGDRDFYLTTLSSILAMTLLYILMLLPILFASSLIFLIVLGTILSLVTFYAATVNLRNMFPYDILDQRLNKIKMEMIRIIRTYKLTKDEQELLLKQIEGVKKLIAELRQDGKINTFLNHLFNVNGGIILSNEKELVLKLQNLIDNELHYYALKLQS